MPNDKAEQLNVTKGNEHPEEWNKMPNRLLTDRKIARAIQIAYDRPDLDENYVSSQDRVVAEASQIETINAVVEWLEKRKQAKKKRHKEVLYEPHRTALAAEIAELDFLIFSLKQGEILNGRKKTRKN